ncbi:MAG: peptidase [Mycobacteriales bacterium]
MPRARTALPGVAVAALVAVLATPGFAASPTPTSSCPPGIGVGLLQIPTDRADDPRARAYVIDHVMPGAQLSRTFQVCNGTGAATSVRLYAAAAEVRNGTFALDPAEQQNDVSRAISVIPGALSLAKGAIGVATARFAVPRDARSGEQYAVIYAEVTSTRGGEVVARSRAGIRVYLDIAPGGEQPSDFQIDSLTAGRTAAGLPVVAAAVTNTGARALDLVGELKLSEGPGALSAGPFPVTGGTTIGVGQTQPVSITLPKQITGGPWTADLTLRSGLLERDATAQITFPDAAGATAPPVAATPKSFTAEHNVLLPFAAGLIGLLIVLLITVGYLTSRRRARERTPS